QVDVRLRRRGRQLHFDADGAFGDLEKEAVGAVEQLRREHFRDHRGAQSAGRKLIDLGLEGGGGEEQREDRKAAADRHSSKVRTPTRGSNGAPSVSQSPPKADRFDLPSGGRLE